MPGSPDCLACPFRDDPETSCHALVSGHRAFCAPARHDLRVAVRKLTLQLAGKWVEPERPPPPPRPPHAEPPLPPTTTTATNAGAALVRNVAAGFRRADAALVAARLATCHGCDRYRLSDKRCSVCGCFVEPKAAAAVEKCPLNRWPGDAEAPAVAAPAPPAGDCGCKGTPTA